MLCQIKADFFLVFLVDHNCFANSDCLRFYCFTSNSIDNFYIAPSASHWEISQLFDLFISTLISSSDDNFHYIVGGGTRVSSVVLNILELNNLRISRARKTKNLGSLQKSVQNFFFIEFRANFLYERSLFLAFEVQQFQPSCEQRVFTYKQIKFYKPNLSSTYILHLRNCLNVFI